MKLQFEPFDGRSFNDRDVFDAETNRVVGWIASGRQSAGIHIHLFDGKYDTTVSTYQECIGYVNGVAAALNRMTDPANYLGLAPAMVDRVLHRVGTN